MASGRLAVAEYVEPFASRMEAHAGLNALIHGDGEGLRAAARRLDEARRGGAEPGPLFGLPLVVKDNIDTVDMPTSGGTAALRGRFPKNNAGVVSALLGAGAILAGKAGLHELACGTTSDNAVFGPIRNPYDLEMIPGGSSGGTAVAIAARMAPLGLGSDTGGSARIPAALCGVAGMRPSSGRYDGRGVINLSPSRDTIGPMGRGVADLAVLDAAITGETDLPDPPEIRGLRLGVPRARFWDDLDGELEAVMDAALTRLSREGAHLVEAEIPDIDALTDAVSFAIVMYEMPRALTAYLEANGYGLTLDDLVAAVASPDVREMMAHFFDEAPVTAEAYAEARRLGLPRLRRAFESYFADHRLDAIVIPATQAPARPLPVADTITINGKEFPTFLSYIRNTDPSSAAGLPCLSIPAGLTASGLPVGLELQGTWNSDRRLLAIAAAVEEVLPDLPRPVF